MGVREILAPERIERLSGVPAVFLAGTIDQGTSNDWRARAVARLAQLDRDIVVFNPRRRAWDASWRGDEDTRTVSPPVDPVAQACRSRAVPG